MVNNYISHGFNSETGLTICNRDIMNFGKYQTKVLTHNPSCTRCKAKMPAYDGNGFKIRVSFQPDCIDLSVVYMAYGEQKASIGQLKVYRGLKYQGFRGGYRTENDHSKYEQIESWANYTDHGVKGHASICLNDIDHRVSLVTAYASVSANLEHIQVSINTGYAPSVFIECKPSYNQLLELYTYMRAILKMIQA